MDRDVLKLFLRAGPARRFDVCYFTQRLLKAGESESFLFTTPFLNNAILFKCVDFSPDKHREEHQTVGTLVYMPYDSSKAGDGGEAFFFTEANFLRYYEYKASSIETMSIVPSGRHPRPEGWAGTVTMDSTLPAGSTAST